MLWKNGLKTRPLRLSPGGRREICLQVRVWPRGLVLHGVSWQSAAGAENWHGAADQRGGHGAAVALWRKHGIRTGGTLLPAAPLQRGLRLLTSAPQNPHLHPTLLPAASIRTHETVMSSNSQPLGELDWTHTCSGASLPLCLKHVHVLLLLSFWPHSKMESALYGPEWHDVSLPGASYVIGFLLIYVCTLMWESFRLFGCFLKSLWFWACAALTRLD